MSFVPLACPLLVVSLAADVCRPLLVTNRQTFKLDSILLERSNGNNKQQNYNRTATATHARYRLIDTRDSLSVLLSLILPMNTDSQHRRPSSIALRARRAASETLADAAAHQDEAAVTLS